MNGKGLVAGLAFLSLLLLVPGGRVQAAPLASGSSGISLARKLDHKWQGESPHDRAWQDQRAANGTGGNNRLPNPADGGTVSSSDNSTTLLTPPPRPSLDLARGILLDFSAEDDNWPGLRQFVQQTCQGLGLTVKPFVYDKNTHTLAQAVQDRPALVIVGSCREFSLDEAAMLAAYVQEGGVVLAVPQGATQGIPRATQLNRLLSELGISVTYGRPAGQMRLSRHPATEGVPDSLKTVAGCAVWSYTMWPLASVGQYVMVSQQQFGDGQVLVFDGNTLRPMPNLKPNTPDPNAPFRSFFISCLKWLTAR